MENIVVEGSGQSHAKQQKKKRFLGFDAQPRKAMR